MKKILLTTLIIITLSCNKNDTEQKKLKNLTEKIYLLEEENKDLKDSIKKNKEDFLYSLQLVGVPYNKISKVGKNDSIAVLLQPFGYKLPKYEFYKIENNKKIKINNNNSTFFKYQFKPKSTDDNKIKLYIKIPDKDRFVELNGEIRIDVEN
jgi:hypothetical protein